MWSGSKGSLHTLDLPPLRERKDDIPLLIDVFLEQFNQQRKKQSERKQLIDLQQIYEILQAQDWRHGNIAQLRVAVEEVLFKTRALSITADDFKTVLETNTEQTSFDMIEANKITKEKEQVKETKLPFTSSYEYDVALSFAGEDRVHANALASSLSRRGVKVFYDKYEKATLWGQDLYTYLSNLYENKAHYCIMFLSKDYAAKLWTNHEREAAQARAFKDKRVYILPIRIDDTEIPGILRTTAYLNWHEETVETIADAIMTKLATL